MNSLKFFLLSVCLSTISLLTQAQIDNKAPDYHIWNSVSIGKGDTTRTSLNAWLEIGKYNTNRGMILPRADVFSLGLQEGNFAYDINNRSLWYSDGGQWLELLSRGDADKYDSSFYKASLIAGILKLYRVNGDSTSLNATQNLSLTGNVLSIVGGNSVNLTTSNVNEGTNLYFTNARVQTFADTRYSLNTHAHSLTLTGDVTGSGTVGGTIGLTIPNSSITYAKIQNITSGSLLGRYDVANGVVQEITIGSGLNLNTSSGVLTASTAIEVDPLSVKNQISIDQTANFRILGNGIITGKLGINNISPLYSLDVTGRSNFTDTSRFNTIYMNTIDTTSTYPFYLNALYTNVNRHSLNPLRSNLRIAYTSTPGPAVNGPEGTGLSGGVIIDATNNQNLTHADLGLNGGSFTAGQFGSANVRLLGCVNAQMGVVAGSVTDGFWYKIQLSNTNTIGTAWKNANGFWISSSLDALGTLNSTGFLIGSAHTGHWNNYFGTSLNNYMGTGQTRINDTTGDGISKLYVKGITHTDTLDNYVNLIRNSTLGDPYIINRQTSGVAYLPGRSFSWYPNSASGNNEISYAWWPSNTIWSMALKSTGKGFSELWIGVDSLTHSDFKIKANTTGAVGSYTPNVFTIKDSIQQKFLLNFSINNSTPIFAFNDSSTAGSYSFWINGGVGIKKDSIPLDLGSSFPVIVHDSISGQLKRRYISNGSVTSVGLSAPSVFSVSGSPVTSSGTLALTFAPGQTANSVLATPDGSSGALSLRVLVANDIPNLDAAKITTGTIATARLGSGSGGSGAKFLRDDNTWTNTLAGPFIAQGKISTTVTTEQLRLNYDISNYLAATVSSVGNINLTATGSSPSISLGNATTVAGLLSVTTTSGNQIRSLYDGSNYFTISSGSTGITQFTATGTAPSIYFNQQSYAVGGLATNTASTGLSNFSVQGAAGGAVGISTAGLLFGGVAAISAKAWFNGTTSTVASANNGIANAIFGVGAWTTAPSGTHALGVGVAFKAPNITLGTANVTDIANIYIDAAATAVGGNSWGLLTNTAPSKFNGTTSFAGGIWTGNNTSASTAYTNSNFGSFGGDGGSTSSTASILFGGAATVNYRTVFNGIGTSTVAGAGNDIANVIIGAGANTTAGSGTHGIAANLAINIPTFTIGTAPITDATSLYIKGAPTTGTNRWAAYINGAITTNGNTIVGKTEFFNDNSTNLSSTAWSKHYADSVAALKVNISDTTTMLSGYALLNGRSGGQTLHGGTTTATDFLIFKNYQSSLSPVRIDSNGIDIGSSAGLSGVMLRAAKTYANPSVNINGLRIEPSVFENASTHNSGLIGILVQPTITAANTQNWGTAFYQGISVAPTILSGATGLIPNVVSGTFVINGVAAGATIDTATGIRIYIPSSAITTRNNTTMLSLGGSVIGGNWGLWNATGYNNAMGTGITFLNSTTDNGLGEKLQVNGRVSILKATQSIDAVRKDQLDSVAALTSAPTLQSVTSAPNGNNTNQLIQIKGQAGNILPGSSLEISIDTTNQVADIQSLSRPAVTSIPLRIQNIAGTYAKPTVTAIGGQGGSVTLFNADWNLLDSGHTSLLVGASEGHRIRPTSVTTTLNASDNTIIVNNTGSVNIVLPTASSCYFNGGTQIGREYTIIKASAIANNVVIVPIAGANISGQSTLTLTAQYSSVTIQSDGTNWYIKSSNVGGAAL